MSLVSSNMLQNVGMGLLPLIAGKSPYQNEKPVKAFTDAISPGNVAGTLNDKITPGPSTQAQPAPTPAPQNNQAFTTMATMGHPGGAGQGQLLQQWLGPIFNQGGQFQ